MDGISAGRAAKPAADSRRYGPVASGSKDAKAAGSYAQQRYQRGLRSWRARTRWLLAAFFAPFIILGSIPLILDGPTLVWCAGVISGVALGAWIALREEPPHYIEKWQTGAEGERKTAKALEPLQRSGMHVVHDVQTCRYGNYDHIAVSQAGVFLLETKNLNGTVELRDGASRLRYRHDPEADTPIQQMPARTLSAAANLKQDIQQRTGQSTWVQAVIVLWAEFPQGLAEHGRCVFIHGTKLTAWLQSRPNTISQAVATQITEAIADIARQDA